VEEPAQPSTHLTPDLTPLRESREFRLLFAGQAVSFFGSMMTFVALPWQGRRCSRSCSRS
jgi:hypothetical protein